MARAYAQALVDLGEEKGFDIVSELTIMTEAINGSNDLENLLFLEVFTIEEKKSVLRALLKKMSLSPLAVSFFSFLCQEKRLGLFPLIFKEVIVIDDDRKGFMKGDVLGREAKIDSKEIKKLAEFVGQFLGKKVQLQYEPSDEVTAGYRVSVGDLLWDATVDHQLEEFKKTVLSKEM